MTNDEAKIIAGICATADGGCMYCVRDLFYQLHKRFPDQNWLMLFHDAGQLDCAYWASQVESWREND